MVTFEDARRVVAQLEAPIWGSPGTYMVAEWGREDDTHWQVISGAKEDLVDHDPAYRTNRPVWLVDKVTGEIDWQEYVPGTMTAMKVDAMTIVGDSPRPQRRKAS